MTISVSSFSKWIKYSDSHGRVLCIHSLSQLSIYALNFWKFSKLNPSAEQFKPHSPHVSNSQIFELKHPKMTGMYPHSSQDPWDVANLWGFLYCQLYCVHRKRILHKSVWRWVRLKLFCTKIRSGTVRHNMRNRCTKLIFGNVQQLFWVPASQLVTFSVSDVL